MRFLCVSWNAFTRIYMSVYLTETSGMLCLCNIKGSTTSNAECVFLKALCLGILCLCIYLRYNGSHVMSTYFSRHYSHYKCHVHVFIFWGTVSKNAFTVYFSKRHELEYDKSLFLKTVSLGRRCLYSLGTLITNAQLMCSARVWIGLEEIQKMLYHLPMECKQVIEVPFHGSVWFCCL